MPWYYADNGRQVGPVEDAALDDLVRAGLVRDDTLVWREGMANWQPHSMARGVRPPPPMPAVPIAADSGFCSECGRPFPMSQLVPIGKATVCAQCKPIYLQRVREGGQGIVARRYGGFWIRFVARVIDAFVLGVAVSILLVPVTLLFGISIASLGSTQNFGAIAGAMGMYLLLGFAINLGYEVYFDSTRGGTPGKLLLGMKIIRNDGSLMNAGQATGRFFAYLLSGFTFYIGFIMAGFDSEKRSLHDRICDTRVIYAR
ncbi:MAG TPA: RDD family protein [Bryobacteraceae bacterium]|nr:RDD family protein [Bryobacteraceae bacterium]